MAEQKDWTETVVPRRPGRDVIDLIRTHSGLPPCQNCGTRPAVSSGRVALADVVYDGTKVEAIVYAEPVDPDDPDGEHVFTPLAIVVDDDLAEQIRQLVDDTPEPASPAGLDESEGDE